MSRNSTKASQGKPVLMEEENPLKVDLRIQGIPQDAALEDQGRMTNTQELVVKLPTGCQTESIVVDVGKIVGRTCLMFVVFRRHVMSTMQWSRLETNVSFQPTCCCSVSLLLRSVARKVLFQPSFLVVDTLPAELSRNVQRNRTLHRARTHETC